MNVITIAGNITRDPKLETLKSGTVVLDFSVAVNEKRKVGDDWVESANFFDCAVFGKRAEGLAKVLTKGRSIAVQGKMNLKTTKGDDGKWSTRASVRVDEVTFFSGGAPAAPHEPSNGFAPTSAQNVSDDVPF